MEEKNIPDIDFKIEIATQTLERNIGFINSCDNKASIILTVVGVLLTIILTNEGIIRIFVLLQNCINAKTMCSIIYLILLSAVLLILCAGLVLLINVLIAKVDNSEVSNNSPIFFSGINSYKNIKEYSEKIYKMSKDDILNELISEIYINADIATKKYKKYNIGLKLTISGFIVFIIFILIGLYNF
jgi:hypothetical protein